VRTIFISRLDHGNDAQVVYDFVAARGFIPEDVMILVRKGQISNQALVRFPSEDIAYQAMKAIDRRCVRAFLSRSELLPPTDQRWAGLWLNWKPKG
jgi:RNA recognition motif-containing protein